MASVSPSSVQFRWSVVSSSCNPMDYSMPGFLVHYQLLECAHFMSIRSVMPSNHLISVVPFSFCLQSFPASGFFFFPASQFFVSGGQSIGVSVSASVLPMNIQDWFPLGLTGWVSLQSKGLSRISNTTVQKHQFFSVQLSLWSIFHIHTWLQEKP